MKFLIERELTFKTVPARWEPHAFCDTREQAEERVRMWTKLIDGGRAYRSGGVITAYRYREVDTQPK